MNEVEDYIYQQDDLERELMIYLHQLFVGTYKLVPKVKYRVPFYYGKSWICYLNPLKKGGIELNFARGNELKENNHLLDFRDRKQVGGIVLKGMEDLPINVITVLLEEAMALDAKTPYESKRKGK